MLPIFCLDLRVAVVDEADVILAALPFLILVIHQLSHLASIETLILAEPDTMN